MLPSQDGTGVAAPGWRPWAERAALVVLVALIVAGGVLWWLRRSASPPLEIALAEATSQVIVYVGGAVDRPGIYSLGPDSRVADALQAAGGVAADADLGAIDLKQRLEDGGQLHVYRRGELPQRINVNTADVWLLEALPGVGEKTAQKIVDYRSQHGPFQRLEELRDLKLVSASTFDEIRDRITLGP